MPDFDPSTLPELSFPEHLPVSARRADIAAALSAHQVVIVCGETGSGKTTQLPKIALGAGRGVRGRVGMTQPRRIAAKTVAHRIAEETQSELGGLVGWQVRFTDQVSAQSRIKVMTDGILLAETQSDPEFRAYDTLILDEAHERSLNIDFLLGYLKTLLPRRPDLKLILSSATIEADRFSEYFNGAPVVEVSGRTYPVEVRYRPAGETGNEKRETPAAPDAEPDLSTALLHAVDELAAEGPGDILVFLPGEREIREAMEDLRKHHPPQTEILPLFARLSVSEQEKVFAPHGGRRIVLATNVAETSLTVPGIRYVVDTGQARVKRYSIRNKIEQLKIEKVSQASANQRMGRCGRVAEGICIRLFDEQDFQSRPRYTTPELLRSSLAGVILRMKSLHLPEIDAFPFLDPPEAKRVRDGQQLLAELGALDEAGRLTPVGKQLARLPVDPRIGRMLIAAKEKAVLHEALVIAAFLSVQDPRDRPLEAQQAADERHRRFADPNSDFIAILKLWHYLDELNAHRKSQKKLREQLRKEFLSPNRAREWRDVYGQLAVQVKELGWKISTPPPPGEGAQRAGEGATAEIPSPPNPASLPHPSPPPAGEGVVVAYAPLHQALMTGLLGNLGMLTEDGVYLGARDMKFLPFPGSGVKKKPKWVMAAEIVETRRVYARTIAKVEPEWIEHIARHLLKISYSDPHWAKKPAHVSAAMRATLYGLPVVNGRPIHYGPLDPTLCREIFIRAALVQGDWDSRAPFFQHNRRLFDEIEDLAQRTRNARLELDEQRVYDFFDARVPEGIHNGAAFDKWRHSYEKDKPRGLFLSKEDLLDPQSDAQARDYPPFLEHHGSRFPLGYRFEPGAADDGVTLQVPLAVLNQVPAAACDWLVPGLLEEKIAALLKSLPQGIRRNFVPVPEFARAAADALAPHSHPGAGSPSPLQGGSRRGNGVPPLLTDALTAFLHKRTGQAIPRDAWRPEALAPHLHMNFRVLDEKGKTLAEGRDLVALRQQLGGQAAQAMAQTSSSSRSGFQERTAVTQWDFGDLPDSVPLQGPDKNGRLHAFPALRLTDAGVALALLDSPAAARHAHRLGTARLIWLAYPDLLKQTERDLASQLKSACLQMGLLFKGSRCETLVRDVTVAAALAAVPALANPAQPAPIRTQTVFQSTCAQARPRLQGSAAAIARLLQEVLGAAQRLSQALAKAPAHIKSAVTDLQAQLDELVFPGFLLAHPPERLAHLPRYLKAMELRLGKLPHHQARDQGSMNEMAGLLAAFRQRARQQDPQVWDPDLEDFRWLLQELRVGLFTQELKTPTPVSVKRLDKRWQEITH